MIVGTISYMSPEQAEGKKLECADRHFQLRRSAHEILTGRRAFVGDSTASILSAICAMSPSRRPRSRRAFRGARPDRYALLRKEPDRRYQHAGDLKIDLEQVREEPAADGFRNPGAGEAERAALVVAGGRRGVCGCFGRRRMAAPWP